MRIALFATCIVDAMYPRTARATVAILERLGHEVVFPPGQACCGQMHVNSGYFKEARPVVA
ncbi:heterodisulfide reductase-related iron-sulfur binding cluster, partial [Arthrobacter silviterrae]